MAIKTYEPAYITNLDDESDDGSVICMFRPNEFTLSRTNNWNTSGKAAKQDEPEPDFGGGSPITFSLKLLFDTYEQEDSEQDVRLITKKLWKMSMIQESLKDADNAQGRPPKVQFVWGGNTPIIAFITSITERFMLFLNDGTPVRSEVTLNLRQVLLKKKRQNPTSGSPTSTRVHTVKQGETIDWIAYHVYGDANAWRYLAAVNNLDDPTALRPGQRLLIASRR
jgi:nucleoid-associated protein YgaU